MYASRKNDLYIHDDQGVYAPFEHQRIIAKLTTGLGVLYHYKHSIALEPLPETMIDESQASSVPDVILYDNEAEQTRIIIEVCHTKTLKNDIKKIINLIDNNEYGILEGFVYDYKAHQWYKYRKATGGITDSSAFSDLLQIDLSLFL
jgi:hypothetical protein